MIFFNSQTIKVNNFKKQKHVHMLTICHGGCIYQNANTAVADDACKTQFYEYMPSPKQQAL